MGNCHRVLNNNNNSSSSSSSKDSLDSISLDISKDSIMEEGTNSNMELVEEEEGLGMVVVGMACKVCCQLYQYSWLMDKWHIWYNNQVVVVVVGMEEGEGGGEEEVVVDTIGGSPIENDDGRGGDSCLVIGICGCHHVKTRKRVCMIERRE